MILKLSSRILNRGEAQFVVQEALDITSLFLKSSSLSFTPKTTWGVSSSFEGAVNTTFFTDPRRCFLRSSFLLKAPVASTTISTSYFSQGILDGSSPRVVVI